MIDSLTEWQVEYIIEAEAIVRQGFSSYWCGVSERRMLAGKSDDESDAILKSRLDCVNR